MKDEHVSGIESLTSIDVFQSKVLDTRLSTLQPQASELHRLHTISNGRFLNEFYHAVLVDHEQGFILTCTSICWCMYTALET